jgi:endonuclease YncB( thermonuclease family)
MSRSGQQRRQRPYPRPARTPLRKLFDYGLTAAIVGLLALVSVRLDNVSTRQADGNAVINDGDSITIAGDRIRLRGIDAPELDQSCDRSGEAYPCGRRSRESLAKLVANRAVSCSGWERDQFDRLLAECSAGGTNLNAGQVEAGWAIAYGGYQAQEAIARRNGAGLWSGSFERPREWRDRQGITIETEHDMMSQIVNWLRQILPFW